MNGLNLNFASVHEIGNREEQQDRIAHVRFQNRHRFILVDGMGGTQEGAEAAERILSDLRSSVSLKEAARKAHVNFQEWLKTTFPDVEAKELPGAVATVLELNLSSGRGTIFHLGDTRLYRGTNNNFVCLTEDQVNENGHVIQDFGRTDIQPIFMDTEFDENTQFVLCSDGLYESLDSNDVLDLQLFFGSGSVEEIATKIKLERSADFNDNASAYFIRFERQVENAKPVPRRRLLKLIGIGSVCLFGGFVGASSLDSCMDSIQKVPQSGSPKVKVIPEVETPANKTKQGPIPVNMIGVKKRRDQAQQAEGATENQEKTDKSKEETEPSQPSQGE